MNSRPESEMLVEALRCVAKQGRTPLAEAIAFFHERPRWVNVQSPELVEHAAADVILPLCKGDPLTFQSDVPLVHLAAEWGRETILAALDEAGAIERGVLTAGNETPFHFLNVGASQSFIETLGRVYGTESLALLSSSGKSAAEAFMDRLAELAPPSSDASNPQPQAAEQQQVDAAVFQTLLVPAVVRSKDSEGLTFWERFCYKILAACRLSLTPLLLDSHHRLARSLAFSRSICDTNVHATGSRLPHISRVPKRGSRYFVSVH